MFGNLREVDVARRGTCRRRKFDSEGEQLGNRVGKFVNQTVGSYRRWTGFEVLESFNQLQSNWNSMDLLLNGKRRRNRKFRRLFEIR